jgi:hypothetical protein
LSGLPIDLAIKRRGELVQAINLAEVTALAIEAQATSCRATSNETVFRQLLALAAFQRVTAGGFSLGLDGQAQEGH